MIVCALAGFPYGGWVRPALLGAKYQGERDRATFLGECLADDAAIAEVIERADVIVPVPMHRSAQLERGYNQADLMAAALGAASDRPVLGEALEKPEARVSQVALTGRQRRRNVEHAFLLAADHGIRPGRRIVIVDDTRTTGATVSACAEALAASRPAMINVVSVAIEYTRDQQEEAALVPGKDRLAALAVRDHPAW